MTKSSIKRAPPWGRITLVAAAVATAVMFTAPPLGEVLQTDYLVGSAVAAQQMGGKGGADKMTGAQGQRGGLGAYRQGQSNLSKILAEDDGDDSDRPAWAGGDKDENPHRGDGNSGTDSEKGGDYGDIWIILRDDLGNPILDANDNVQPCTDPACTSYIQLNADGELDPQYADDVIEVEFGRLNIARSPTSVLDHALAEALDKLDGLVWGDEVVVDEAGRLVIGDATIDSPLENLALFRELVTTDAVDGFVTLSFTTQVEGEGMVELSFTVPESVRLDLAASAIAAASDKTGELTVDEVVNISKFLEVDGDLAALVGTYEYDRDTTYAGDSVTIVVFEYDADGNVIGSHIETAVILEAVDFNNLPVITDNGDGSDDGDGIDQFAQAADDAVQVLEFVHENAID